jgi:hypothetical protein
VLAFFNQCAFSKLCERILAARVTGISPEVFMHIYFNSMAVRSAQEAADADQAAVAGGAEIRRRLLRAGQSVGAAGQNTGTVQGVTEDQSALIGQWSDSPRSEAPPKDKRINPPKGEELDLA